MYAYKFDSSKGLESLRRYSYEMPKPQRGEVLIKVHSVALNFRDLMIPMKRYFWPFIPGLVPCSDAAGEVVEIGADVQGYKVGDKVISAYHPRWFGGPLPPRSVLRESYGSGQDGWLMEYKAVSQDAIVRMPIGLTYAEACTLPCAGLTAWNALVGANPIHTGDVILTQGTGGVSVFAIQLAKALGAHVIALTSSGAKEQYLKTLGADKTINYNTVPDWGPLVKKMTMDGVDKVVEVVGPATFRKSLKAVRWCGEIVVIGLLSDSGPEIPFFEIKGSGAMIRSVAVGSRVQLEELVRVVETLEIRPVIDREFRFKHSLDAFKYLADGRHMGKVVINVV